MDFQLKGISVLYKTNIHIKLPDTIAESVRICEERTAVGSELWEAAIGKITSDNKVTCETSNKANVRYHRR